MAMNENVFEQCQLDENKKPVAYFRMPFEGVRFKALVYFSISLIAERFSRWLRKTRYGYFITTKTDILIEASGSDNYDLLIIEFESYTECRKYLPQVKENYKGKVVALANTRRSLDCRIGNFREMDVVYYMSIKRGAFVTMLDNYANGVPVTEQKAEQIQHKPAVKVKIEFLDEAEKVMASFNKSGISRARFVKKIKMKPSLFDNHRKIAGLPDSVKTIIRNNPLIFGKKKSFFCEHLYKYEEKIVIEIMNEIIAVEKTGVPYTIDSLKKRLGQIQQREPTEHG
jgi:hypothetical protein